MSRILPVLALAAIACLSGVDGQPLVATPTRAAAQAGALPGSARPWPPGVQAVAPDSPPRSPDEERDTFFLAPGYRVELVAAEPLVQDPIAIDWDPQGRVWVVEMPGYMADVASTEHEPLGRVVVLEDRDGDGRMDRRTVFAEGLVLARSVKVLAGGVLVAEPPDVWLMKDTNGDLRMDTKERVTDRFGRRDIDVQNNANSFDWSLDNRLRSAGQSGLHLQWKAGTLLAAPSPTRGQWGVSHDDAGRTYRNSNESALHVDMVAGEYFARHPALLRTRGSYERLSMPDNDLNAVWPVRPTPGLNRGYQAGVRRADGTLARYTAACSPLVYRGDRLPAEVYGNVFIADPAGNVVSRITLRDDGAGVRASKAYPDAEFLASTDERFRPVFLANAPDGTLTVVDMYRGLIEHRLSLTVYLKAYAEQHGLLAPRGLGRIWRVVHDTTVRDTAPVPADEAGLLAMLAHPNGWRRDTAQRLLVQRGESTAAPALERLARTAPDARTRVHALWTLDGLDAITTGHVQLALDDPSPDVRAAALRIAERWIDVPSHVLHALVIARTADPDARVRLQAAATLGTLADGDRKWDAAAALLQARGDDPVLVDVVLSGLRGAERPVFDRLVSAAAAGASPASTHPALTMLTATLLRTAREQDAQRVLGAIATEVDRTPALAAALMHGAEIGILGAPVPGQLPALPPPPGATCPTCPGGRLSEGGAYAYAWPASRPAPAAPPLRLARAPEPFIALATRDSVIGKQAATVLTRVSWPGKPGDVAAPPPLTTEEQARFDAGRVLFQALCQACHQADGRGQPGRAASLVGSPIAQHADAAVPARVLLHGKEGQTGLMPALGAAMTDAQIAQVLTYVRREWGQEGSPVTPTLIGRVRATTKARRTPWTDAELAKVR